MANKELSDDELKTFLELFHPMMDYESNVSEWEEWQVNRMLEDGIQDEQDRKVARELFASYLAWVPLGKIRQECLTITPE